LEKPVVKKTRTASFVVSVVLLIFAALAAATREVLKLQKDGAPPSMEVGYFFGAILGFGLIAAVVIFIIFRFKSVNVRANTMLVLSSLVFTLLVAGCFADVIKEKQKEREQERAAISKLTDLMNEAASGKRINDSDLTKEKYGVNNELLLTFTKFFNGMIDEKDKYITKVKDYNFDKYYNKESLSNKKTIQKAMNDVRDMQDEIKIYKETYEKMVKAYGESIKDMKVSEAYKESFLKGYDKGIKSNKERMDDYFRIENELFEDMYNYFDFFDKLNGKFDFKNGQYLFQTQNEVDKFNGLVTNVKDIADEESKWFEDNEQKTKENIEKFKKETEGDN
ncbi:MAG TPA: DUF3053 family protein, partial [Clostridia bacterium]